VAYHWARRWRRHRRRGYSLGCIRSSCLPMLRRGLTDPRMRRRYWRIARPYWMRRRRRPYGGRRYGGRRYGYGLPRRVRPSAQSRTRPAMRSTAMPATRPTARPATRPTARPTTRPSYVARPATNPTATPNARRRARVRPGGI
jgi:hypothetical protein